MNFDELGVKHGTDKSSQGHNYLVHYQNHMPSSPERILEIGCEQGESLRMWKEIYPQAEIHTIDLFINPNFAQEREIAGQGFYTHRGDQFYRRTYDSLTGQFDAIIEDGSHRSDHMIFTLYMLFERFVKPGGLYVAEDLHCNRDDFFNGTISDYNQSLLAALENKGSWFYAQYGQLIESVDIYKRNIAFIKKR